MEKFNKKNIENTKEMLNVLIDRAIQVAVIKHKYHKKDFSHLEICKDDVEVVFSVSESYNGYQDYHVDISFDDLVKSEEQLLQDEQDRLAEEEKERLRKIDIYNKSQKRKETKAQELKDKEEIKIYNRLHKKYGKEKEN